ncbi:MULTISPECIES: branched-chain amino acid ABC transporter permease [Halococcus]|uniref:Putative branched-chain amino acids ABC transporter permease n=1 Tax=Halococcus salifodinae DSM 8989 TaxID=1227456 RepID=M0N628_9EURY|nr:MULTISPECIES: branched-chain amino acid ABC transporter permease [Halococcus]EMA53336.1 putative branched-chain amino acids ABC transporter permease [Halococcus salifodinae DSM 8989]
MGISETYNRGRSFVVEQPFEVIAGVVGVLLIVDLATKLMNGSLSVLSLSLFLKDGLIQGLVIALAGVGLSMTYSLLGFANFAHGDYITAGAFAGWATTYVIGGLGALPIADLFLVGVSGEANAGTVGVSIVSTPIAVLVGLVVAIAFTAGLALLVDRLVYKPMRSEEGITLLIASIGVALALRYLLAFVFGTSRPGVTGGDIPGITLSDIEILGISPIPIAIRLNAHEATLAIGAIALMVGVHVLLQYTKLGTAMRAMADNRDLARVTGIPTERVVRATWIIGGGLTGAAGYLVTLETGTIAFDFGWILLLLIFAAVILGGIGSVYGAMFGGLTIGIASTVSLVWLPSEFTTAAAFAVMILILVLRPAGLFGGVTTA